MDDLAHLEADVDRHRDDPDRWALSAYRLALARSEVATGSDDLTTALELLERAGRVLTADRAPLEHSRILTVAANCHRLLRQHDRAASLFERAAKLAESRTHPTEVASTLTNLGLVHAEAGRPTRAVEALDRAVDLLQREHDAPDVARLLGAALVNRAQAQQVGGPDADLGRSAADYARARELLEPSSVQAAMAAHGLGTVRLEQHRRTGAPSALDEGLRAFEDSLAVLTRATFPFQHAIARHSLAVALDRRAGPGDLDRALHHVETALTTFDPRVHVAQWRAAQETMRQILDRLDDERGSQSHIEHLAEHVSTTDRAERSALLRERFGQLAELPDPVVRTRAGPLAAALAARPIEEYRRVLPELLHVLMELPDRVLDTTASTICAAHAAAADTEARDRALDDAIHETLFGPQRVRVRDLLESYGWTRW